ncbi:DEKNAAC102912 [Brettanomyces naardenensis]|uniref:DEKNAAC102912 n=1 Tax=Brettanomyces naardenensis TaxID=13370 RepID=A0A448YLZ3_BRENA|nr:DEKNAAC102912 [Brettanomyces naardenensis]
MSLYQLDNSTKNLLSLDNFLEDLSVTEFVDHLAKQNVQYKSQFNNGVEYIDPKPFIRTFELVQKDLDKLSQECLTKRDKLEQRASEKSIQHYQNVLKLNSRASALNKSYKSLTLDVSRLYGSKINPLGEKLSVANTLKEHSLDLIFLTKCYNEFYTSEKPPKEITEYTPRDMDRVAKVLSQLLVLSSKLSDDTKLPNSKRARELIVQQADLFEKNQLENFNKYYSQKDLEKSHEIAEVLFKFNGGVHLVENFVGNHPIFSHIGNDQPLVDREYWTSLGNPDKASFSLDDSTSKLLSSVSEHFVAELDTITEIFQKNSDTVLEALIGKLFGQVIQGRVSYLVKLASSYSKLAFVRILHLSATETYRLTVSKISSSLEERDLQLSTALDRAYNDIFIVYLKDDAQFKTEKNNLLELLDSLTCHTDEKAVQKHTLADKINSFKDEHTNVTVDGKDDEFEDDQPASSSFREKARKLLPYSKRGRHFTSISGFIKSSDRASGWRERLKLSGIGSGHLSFGSPSSSSNLAPSTTLSASVETLSPLAVTQRIFNYVVESLNRAIELVPGKINEYSMDIFEILMFKVGPSYILAELESVYYNGVFLPRQKLSSFFSSVTNSNNNIDLSFLSQFNTISFQLYLLSMVVKRSFYPLLLSDSVKGRLVNIFNSFLQDMEIGLNITLAGLVELIDANVRTILSGQNAEDFCPRTQNVVIDKTITCDKLTQFVDYVLKAVHSNLASNPPLELEMVKRISSSFLEALIEHFMKFRVNSTGSLIITQDVIHYISVFDSYNFEDLKRRRDSAIKGVPRVLIVNEDAGTTKENFLILKELANLFSCQPELLKDLCNEGKLTYLKRNVLREYVRNRIDFRDSFLDGI